MLVRIEGDGGDEAEADEGAGAVGDALAHEVDSRAVAEADEGGSGLPRRRELRDAAEGGAQQPLDEEHEGERPDRGPLGDAPDGEEDGDVGLGAEDGRDGDRTRRSRSRRPRRRRARTRSRGTPAEAMAAAQPASRRAICQVGTGDIQVKVKVPDRTSAPSTASPMTRQVTGITRPNRACAATPGERPHGGVVDGAGDEPEQHRGAGRDQRADPAPARAGRRGACRRRARAWPAVAAERS